MAASMLTLAACSSGGSSGGDPGLGNGTVNGFHVVGFTEYNEFDEITRTRTYVYDLDLNRIDITTTIPDAEVVGMNRVSTSREFYDEQGNLTSRETPEDGQLRINSFTFNDAGLIVTSSVSGGSRSTNSTSLEYDAAGNMVKAITIVPGAVDDADTTTTTRTFVYDSAGNLLSGVRNESFFDVTTQMQDSQITNSTYTNNSLGQRIRIDSVDTSPGGTAFSRIYRYDSNGNMIERTLEDNGFFSRIVYAYEPNEEPIYNLWLRAFKFFP